jgi:hypothetical protein
MLCNSKLQAHFVRKYFLMTVERMHDTNGPTKEGAMKSVSETTSGTFHSVILLLLKSEMLLNKKHMDILECHKVAENLHRQHCDPSDLQETFPK